MESPLIPASDKRALSDAQEGGEPGLRTKGQFLAEVKRQAWLAGPLIAASLLQYILQVISVMFVGHLGELALSGASMATSMAAVTGFSLLVCGCLLLAHMDAFELVLSTRPSSCCLLVKPLDVKVVSCKRSIAF